MKKALLATLGIASLGMASYAARYMQVLTDDGKIVRYDVEHVTEVNFTEDEVSPEDTTPASNHEYVDLGLPSGTLWATYNIGATKPEEYGDYFAWGETKPKGVYDGSTYKYAISKDGNLDSFTKYNSNDGLTTLLSEDDAATANWGSDWHTPTMEEQQELIDNCQYQWTEVNGVTGGKFTASNGNSIFLPAAGNRQGSELFTVSGDCYRYGFYLSSSLFEEIDDFARLLSIYKDEAICGAYNRVYGFPVRAVRAKK